MRIIQSILILFFLSITSINSLSIEDKRGIFVTNLQNFITKDLTLPSGASQFVLSVTPSTSIIFQGVTLTNLPKVQKKFGLSSGIVTQIKAAQYASSSNVYSKISESLIPSFGTYKETLGSAFRDGDMIYFAIITVDSWADLQARKVNVCKEECSGWWIFESCSENCQMEDTGYTASDKDLISKAIKYYSNQNLLKYINELKKPGFQTYISDGNYILSSDGLSKAFVTNFGAIGLGTVEDINFFEPIKSMKFLGTDGTVKTAVYGSVYEACYMEGSTKKCELFNESKHHHINYVGAINGMKPLKDIFVYRNKNKGAYALKVLNTGNLVLYKGTTVVWQTNTAGKGTAPYDLDITNDKKLVLKDSTGTIIYSSPTFKNWRAFQRYQHGGKNGLYDDKSSALVPWWTAETFIVPGTSESNTTPLYLCQYKRYRLRNLIEFITEVEPVNRFVSKSSGCGGYSNVGFMGYVYNTQLSGTVPIYDCNGGDLNDYVTSLGCPSGKSRGIVGYGYPEIYVMQVN